MDGASQESTEPIDWDSGVGTSQGSQSQDQENQPPHFWGRFYPLRSQLSVIDLVENTVSFGKENTSVILTCLNLPRAVFKKCSKIHFEVQRKEVQCVGAMTTQVFIVDKSRNGTYINGHILSRRRPGSNKYVKLLRTNDVIGFPGENPGPGSCFRAYVYIDAIVSPSVPVSNSVQRKYQISLKLGAGAFGEVSLVFDKSKGKAYAMKTVIKERNVKGRVDTYKSKLLNELRILQTVNHPNIIKLVDVVDCPKEHCLILEYMEGKDLSYRIEKSEKLDEDLAKFYFWQITNGVQYLHSQGITHRDLKPANLLLSSSKEETLLKITDFGLSKVLSSATIMKTLCGTKLYVAPEVLFSGGTYEYTNAVDIWSMGVILYLCLSGTEPFLSESSNSVEDLIKEAAFSMPFQLWYSVSDHAQDLIRKMLIKEPGERIITDDILKDPWLQDDIMLEKIKVLYGTFEDNVDLLSNTFIGLNSTFSSTLEVTSQDETHGCSCPTNPPSKKFKRS